MKLRIVAADQVPVYVAHSSMKFPSSVTIQGIRAGTSLNFKKGGKQIPVVRLQGYGGAVFR